MDWGLLLDVINTTDTALGVVFLATSWIVSRSWLRNHRAQAQREAVGAPPAPEAPPDADEWADAG